MGGSQEELFVVGIGKKAAFNDNRGRGGFAADEKVAREVEIILVETTIEGGLHSVGEILAGCASLLKKDLRTSAVRSGVEIHMNADYEVGRGAIYDFLAGEHIASFETAARVAVKSVFVRPRHNDVEAVFLQKSVKFPRDFEIEVAFLDSAFRSDNSAVDSSVAGVDDDSISQVVRYGVAVSLGKDRNAGYHGENQSRKPENSHKKVEFQVRTHNAPLDIIIFTSN